MNGQAAHVIGFADAGEFQQARETLDTVGYTEEALRGALGRADLLETGPNAEPAALVRTRAETPRHSLIRLFFLGVPVSADAASRAVHPMSLDSWCRAGLLGIDGAQAVPLVTLRPYQRLFLASDLQTRMWSAALRDFVVGVSKSAALAAHTAVGCRVRRTLDLGTGCGVLALLASAHSERVWATDKNARAVAFAGFNARLNGIDNVECLTGDLFEPVADRRFDLVICNPPFVISPTARFLFSDSGVRGDDFCRRIVRLGASFLEEGGYCQVLGNWVQSAGRSSQESLASWFDGTGCDALVWAAETQDPSDYATTWIAQTEPAYRDRFPALYDAWMSYYDREGIEAVTYGLITLRRSGRHRNWARFVAAPKGSSAPRGEYILRRIEALDFLEGADDQRLLEQRFRPAPDMRLEQHYVPREEGFAAVTTRLYLARDPGCCVMELDSGVASFVMRYQAGRRLRDVLAEMAAAMQLDLDAVVPGGLASARQLVENGYLVPVADG